MAKKKRALPQHLQDWVEARKRHGLSHAHVQMARELGMNPRKLGKLDNHDQERWKAPLPEYIQHLYLKRFGRDQPEVVASIEERAREQQGKKDARKEASRFARSQADSDTQPPASAALAPFRIPVALNQHAKLVTPIEATRQDSYRCPLCKGTVDLHAGEQKRWHFHHRGTRGSRADCSVESVIHYSAKHLVVDAIVGWIAGLAAAPVFVRKCIESECQARSHQPVPRKVASAVVEHRLHSGRVVDVALLASGITELPVAAIEIVHTHAVDDEKAGEIGVPWIEVDAAQVCESHGRVLVPVRDSFLPWSCEEHRDVLDAIASSRSALERKQDRLRLERLRSAMKLDESPGYRIEQIIASCKSCGHETARLAWDGKEPPWPRPSCVIAIEKELDWSHRGGERRRVLPFRRSWASVCHRCAAML